MVLRTCTSRILIAATLAGSTLLAAQQPAPPAPPPAATPGAPAAGRGGGRGAPPVKSPEVGADRRVTFRLRAPNAKEVAVALGGNRLPMQKDEQGVWSATTDALAPDYYTYSLVVDGTSVNDPANRQVQTSFGSFQSMFAVPGPDPWLPAAGVPRGAVARHAFHSTVANDDRDYFVYTPPGYEPRRSRPYPVMFVLHGLGDDAERWMNGGAANVILDNLIAGGKAVPMVIVTTLGYGVNNGPAGAMAPESITGYTRSLLTEVMPAVERSYNVSRNREERAIAGLSMGGAETLYTALNNLDKFAWIASFSGAFVMWPGAMPPPPPAARGSRCRRSCCCGTAAGRARRTWPRRRTHYRRQRVREELPGARRQGQLADQDVVDHLRDRRLADRREPSVQGLAQVEEREVHRRGSAGRGPCLAAVAQESRRVRAEGVSEELRHHNFRPKPEATR